MGISGISKIFTLFILLQWPVTVVAQKIYGNVVHVKDGDSFVVMSGEKKIEVRLDGIDCPEKSQPFSAKAKQFTSSLILNREITMQVKGYDKYKRALAVVYLPDNRVLNEELLKAGMAWHFKKYNTEKRLAKMEQTARKSRVGLWDDPAPVPPWEFRQNKRQNKK